MEIENLIVEASSNPLDPTHNFKIAVAYENLGQTAAAVSFFLRAAEYGYETHPLITYTSLLKVSICMDRQKDRTHTSLNNILQAIAYMPYRPEGYFLLSQAYERKGSWQECYTSAEMGLQFNGALEPLPSDVSYPGKYGLMFQKAISGWWLGRKDESDKILLSLYETLETLTPAFQILVLNNLNFLNSKRVDALDPLEPVVMNYRKFFGESANTIIDIGSRDGDDAAYLSKKLGGKDVIAIEAREEGAWYIKQKHPWMRVFQTAISEIDGEVTFHKVNSDNKELAGCSSMANKDKTMFPQDFEGIMAEIKVSSARMETFLSNNSIDGLIDVVKVDTEGFTWQVLQGFNERLKDVKLLHLETEKTAIHDAHVLTPEITAFMEANNFFLADISYEWGPDIQDQVWVNKAHAIRCRDVFTS